MLSIRDLIFRLRPHPLMIQKRWAQVHNVRFRYLATNRDHLFEKYREKLDKKAKELGLQDTNELRDVYKEKIDTLKKDLCASLNLSSTPQEIHSKNTFSSSIQPPLPSPPKNSARSSLTPAIKNLSAYIDVDKTRALPLKEIEAIWRLRNMKNAQSLCAVIPLPLYQRMEGLARKYPSFILPLLRENQGAEIHYLQWTFPAENVVTILVTHLAEFKLRGEYSQPHTTITHHLDMAEDKEIVLLQGNVTEGRGVSVDEAKWLLFCLQRFYGGLGEDEKRGKKKEMVEMFGRGDISFNIEELIQEAEKAI
ncbi:putative f1 atpase assembly protein 11 [Erysiphe necator]|uniref:Putative f1 atpase assembly protein 11 n=1 Tax=Uncinula necator TaxID=52586 RepID=A0A0B1P6H1_UNCNE|nr:putative f1 atpase assembly protein 11 [Erysiphe necator]